MEIRQFQEIVARTYGERDAQRGLLGNLGWFVEEVGELSRALRRGTPAQRDEEFADVLAWLVSLAEQSGVDLEAAALTRYGSGCPKCSTLPCACPP